MPSKIRDFLTDPKKRGVLDEVAKVLIQQGRLIEMGWQGVRSLMPDELPQQEEARLKIAYYCGVQHLWGTMMSVMDPGQEPTRDDERRMAQLAEEIDKITDQLTLLAETPEGHG